MDVRQIFPVKLYLTDQIKNYYYCKSPLLFHVLAQKIFFHFILKSNQL